MNTNINWLTDASGVAGAVVNQIQSWPAAVLLFVCLIVLGGTLKSLRLFPNKFIPMTLWIVGALMYVVIGDPGKVPPEQIHPNAILGMRGIVTAFAANLFHLLVLKRLEKYIPIFKTNGDTAFVQKPERQLTRSDIGLDNPPDDPAK